MPGSHPVEGTPDHLARTTRRLNLHIPNAYPRATSPRHSPIRSPSPSLTTTPVLGPVVSEAEDTFLQETAVPTYGSVTPQHEGAREAEIPSSNRANKRWLDYFRATTTSGESSRDFLARERTYFSWLRLATFLAIASIALFLRLRLRIFATESPSPSPNAIVSATSKYSAQYFVEALAKKALRKRLAAHRRDLIYDKTAYTTISPALIMQKPSSPYPSDDDDSDDGILDTDPLFSKVLGSFFFVLSIVALVVGHIDYMRCERALEEADKLITLDDQISLNRQASRLHNAQSARQAHSNHLVHVVEIIIALSIFAVALIILITVNQGSIEPVHGFHL